MATTILPKQVRDITGMRHGRLVALEFLGTGHKSRSAIWRFACDCGAVIDKPNFGFGRLGARSCGCLHADEMRQKRPNMTHGDAGFNRSSEYVTWFSMIQRCTNKNHKQYKNYGGSGVAVCERWLNSFECFLSDMGRKPTTSHSIDRISSAGDYSPENCRWATHKEQQNNRSNNRLVHFDGITWTCTLLAEHLGIPARTMFNWINKAPCNDVSAYIIEMMAKRRAKALLRS